MRGGDGEIVRREMYIQVASGLLLLSNELNQSIHPWWATKLHSRIGCDPAPHRLPYPVYPGVLG